MESNNAGGSIDYVEKVSRLLASDMYRMRCLTALRELALPQGYIGAGFYETPFGMYFTTNLLQHH